MAGGSYLDMQPLNVWFFRTSHNQCRPLLNAEKWEPAKVFAGWLHYCVFDPLVGLGEVLDSQKLKAGEESLNFPKIPSMDVKLVCA